MPQVTRLRVVGAAMAAGALTLGSLASATAAHGAKPAEPTSEREGTRITKEPPRARSRRYEP